MEVLLDVSTKYLVLNNFQRQLKTEIFEMSIVDYEDINALVTEYLRAQGMSKTAACIEQEIKNKFINRKTKIYTKGLETPRLMSMKKSNFQLNKREVNLEKDLTQGQKKLKQVLSASKNVFGVTYNLVQLLSEFKEAQKPEIAEMIETYKGQLAKYFKVIENEGKPQNEEPTQTVFFEHKNKLQKYVAEKNIDGICEVLLSFRVNALQIAPELRKNLVYELIRNDLFKIEECENFQFLLDLLDNQNAKLRYSLLPLISIICSTLRGVQYITSRKDLVVVKRIIKILKAEKNGTVIQRFCLALLQKCSVKENVVPAFVEEDLINWLMQLIQISIKDKSIHHFSLDFGSALLANIIHAPTTLAHLSANPPYAQQLMETMLRFMREDVQVSVLMHILICLSYLSKEEYFKTQKENCNFVERISDFVEYYSQINTAENQAAEIDKRTVLDLCAHMFHPKDVDLDNSESMEYNELKTEDRIREYENEQGELIFECFQDEV